METITYHKADINDLEILIDTRINFLTEYWGTQDEKTETDLRKGLETYFSETIRDKTYICWFAKAGNVVAGVGGMIIRRQPGNFKNPTGKIGYVMNMYTFPAYRRKGICSKILEKLVENGKELGLTLFELHATKEGQDVYPKLGFKIRDEPAYRKFI